MINTIDKQRFALLSENSYFYKIAKVLPYVSQVKIYIERREKPALVFKIYPQACSLKGNDLINEDAIITNELDDVLGFIIRNMVYVMDYLTKKEVSYVEVYLKDSNKKINLNRLTKEEIEKFNPNTHKGFKTKTPKKNTISHLENSVRRMI